MKEFDFNFLKNLENIITYKRNTNGKYGKDYYIDKINKTVTKYKLCDSQLEVQIVSYLCNYYNNTLHLNFYTSYNKNTHKLTITSPFLNVLKEDTILSKDIIYKNTNILLQNFIKDTNQIKYCIPNTSIYCYCETCNPENYFILDNEIYLLDLETFYLCVFDKNNKSLGLKGIKSEYKKLFKLFVIHEDPDELIYYPNPIYY